MLIQLFDHHQESTNVNKYYIFSALWENMQRCLIESEMHITVRRSCVYKANVPFMIYR